jgi:hypothetical protein
VATITAAPASARIAIQPMNSPSPSVSGRNTPSTINTIAAAATSSSG